MEANYCKIALAHTLQLKNVESSALFLNADVGKGKDRQIVPHHH